MAKPYHYEGNCHCGAVRVVLGFTRPAAEIQTRSCQCGFCLRQGAITISDPQGEARFELAPGAAGTYQFATRSATSLICRTCGVYAGACLTIDGATWSIANVRGLQIEAFRGRAGEPMSYDGETAAERTARRMQRWTPTEFRYKL